MKKVQEFENFLGEKEYSINTIRTYSQTVKLFFTKYDSVTKDNVIRFKSDLLENYSPSTAANRVIAINAYCGFIGRSDCKVRSVRIQKRTTVENVISAEEFELLLKNLREAQNWKVYWIVQFLAKTGARASELVRFETKHLKTGVVTIWTKGKVRRIIIPPSLIIESWDYFEGKTGYLFPNRFGEKMSRRGMYGLIQSAGLRCGIRKEVLHPHSFRHLYAIQFLKSTANIALLADLLGHESVNTTSIYLRLSEQEQRQQLENAMKW